MGDSMSTIINATTTNGVVIQPDNSGSLVLQTNNGTTALTIDTAQNATFAAQATIPTINLTGGQIVFPATQSASANANTLDDYEEGTFTPTLASGFSSGPTSYTNQSGRYTKIGRIVFIEIDIDPNGATASAAGITFGGLPFLPAAAPFGSCCIAYQGSFDTNAGDILIIDGGALTISIYTNAGVARAGNAANVNINNRIIFSGFYVV
jgi:hypothetical protein